MATSLYDLGGRTGFAQAQINWPTDTIKAVLVDTGTYTFNQSHANLSDIPAGARIGSIVALTGKAMVAGACDADDVTFPSVSGTSAEAVVLFKDGGTEATSPLIIFMDNTSVTGLPITPNTGDIILQFDNGANRVFKL